MVILQLFGWGVILASLIYGSISSKSHIFDSFGLMVLALNICVLLLIYLLNYFLFIPRFLFDGERRYFFISNIILVAILLYIGLTINKADVFALFRPEDMPPRPRNNLTFMLRDLISYVLMIGLVTALRLAERLQRSEEALKEAESARVKAELDNLRSQINPHFLLNTLNNIYALTAIDTDKAQKTIKELSNLLRYILYDNLNERVPLKGEVDFLKTYIELMSIRLPRRVTLTTEFNIADSSRTMIAPLIFISLVENAFKHSVSAEGEGFIEINFYDDIANSQVILTIRNSNNAKAEEDKSGHGIGLEQVHRRLELLYAERYNWEITHDDLTYCSTLTLNI